VATPRRARYNRTPIVRWVAAAATVVLYIIAGCVLLERRGNNLLGLLNQPIAVTYGIALTADATGTLVEVVGETADGSLPIHLTVDLMPRDDAQLPQGSQASGSRLLYSDVQDGLGTTMPADQVRTAHLLSVGTDGRRIRLAFHVAAVGGRRIVYPIPQSPALRWVHARLYVQTGTVLCWGNRPAGGTVFSPCQCPAPGEVDGTRHDTIRLELTGASPPS
jgi:hypothetical protein